MVGHAGERVFMLFVLQQIIFFASILHSCKRAGNSFVAKDCRFLKLLQLIIRFTGQRLTELTPTQADNKQKEAKLQTVHSK